MDTIPDDLSIPSFLRRDLTPQARAAITRTNNELRRRDVRRVVASGGRSTISAGHAANLDETGKALLKEVKQNEREKDKREKARLRALPKKGNTMSKTVGKKEQALREKRTGGSKSKPKLAALAAMIPGGGTVKDDSKPRETAPPVSGFKADGPTGNPPKAKKQPKAKPTGDRPDGLKAGTKLAKLLDAAVAAGPKGSTEDELCKKLGGWKKCRVTLRRVVERVGGKLATVDGRLVVTLKKAA